MKAKARITRTLAALIVIALTHSSFGPQAWAQLAPRVGEINAPLVRGSPAPVSLINAASTFGWPAASLTNPAAGAFPAASTVVPFKATPPSASEPATGVSELSEPPTTRPEVSGGAPAAADTSRTDAK